MQVYASASAVQRMLQFLSEGAFIDVRTDGLSGLLVTYNAAAEAFAIADLILARGLHVCPWPSVCLIARVATGTAYTHHMHVSQHNASRSISYPISSSSSAL